MPYLYIPSISVPPCLWLAVLCAGAIAVFLFMRKRGPLQALEKAYAGNKAYIQNCERSFTNFASKLSRFEQQVNSLARTHPDRAIVYETVIGTSRKMLEQYKDNVLKIRAVAANQELEIAILKALGEVEGALAELKNYF